MSASWEHRTIAELCSRVTSGGTPSRSRSDYYGGSIPWVKTGELLDRVVTDTEEKLTDAGLKGSSAKLLPPGTVLMAMYGATVGALGRLGREATCNQASCAMVADSQTTDARWLFYALLNDRPRIVSRATGAAQQNLSAATIKQFSYPAPSLPEQQAIAEVLGALDDKIAANTALSASADSLLTTEFRAGLHRTEAHDKELGAIANVVLGGTPSRARPDYWIDGTIPWLNSGAVNATRIVEPSEFITDQALANSAAKLMPSGTTLLAITGATLGQIARLEMTASGNQSIVGVWSDDVDLNTWLYFAIQARLDDLLARATGAAQQHVSKGDVEQLAVPVPAQVVLEEFSSVATPLLEVAAIAERENRTLASARDALLPQLMSGKLRVRDAEDRIVQAGV